MLNTKQVRKLIKDTASIDSYNAWTNKSFKNYKHQIDKRNMCFTIVDPLSKLEMEKLVDSIGCKRAKQTPGQIRTGLTYLRLIGVNYEGRSQSVKFK